jgi:hypothetical protein
MMAAQIATAAAETPFCGPYQQKKTINIEHRIATCLYPHSVPHHKYWKLSDPAHWLGKSKRRHMESPHVARHFRMSSPWVLTELGDDTMYPRRYHKWDSNLEPVLEIDEDALVLAQTDLELNAFLQDSVTAITDSDSDGDGIDFVVVPPGAILAERALREHNAFVMLEESPPMDDVEPADMGDDGTDTGNNIAEHGDLNTLKCNTFLDFLLASAEGVPATFVCNKPRSSFERTAIAFELGLPASSETDCDSDDSMDGDRLTEDDIMRLARMERKRTHDAYLECP